MKTEPEQQVKDWNERYPIGTPVTRYKLIEPLREPQDTETTSYAWVMGGHSAMVKVKSIAGGVLLESVVPKPEQQPAGQLSQCAICGVIRPLSQPCACDGGSLILGKEQVAPVTHEPWTADFICHLPYFEIAEIHNASITAERGKETGAQHHMEACRALLQVPNDEVLYEAIKQLREQLAAAQSDTRLTVEWHKGWAAAAEANKENVAKACQPLIQGLHRLYALRDPTCQRQAEIAYETALAHWKEKNK